MFLLTFWLCLTVLLVVGYLIFILFLLWGSTRLKNRDYSARPFISVLVAARNEEAWLPRCLESLVEQSYERKNYEILVVDDRSTDRTPDIIASFHRKDPRVVPVTIHSCPSSVSPKKYALTQGLISARGRIIVTTDADSHAPPGWLEALVRCFNDRTSMVMGLVVLEGSGPHHSFLHTFQALEIFSFSTVAAFSAAGGFPLSANSSNLAYRKELFDKIHG